MVRTRRRSPRCSPETLAKARAAVAGLPHVTESVSWGNPTFSVHGKAFAVLDGYKGTACLWFRCPTENRKTLLEREGFFPAPYDRSKLAMCRALADLDDQALQKLIKLGYEEVLGRLP